MMNQSFNRSVVSAVRKLAGTYNQDTVQLVTATVLYVDEDAGLCKVEAVTGSAATEIDGVELQTVISDGLLFIPKVGSEVKVLYSTYTTPFIVQYSEIEKMFIAADKIQFNDGVLEGMVKVISLTTKLNTIENDINQLKTLLTTLVTATAALPPPTPVLGSVVAGLFAPFASYGAQVLVPTIQTEIENPLITQ